MREKTDRGTVKESSGGAEFLARRDPIGFSAALGQLGTQLACRPQAVVAAWTRFATDLAAGAGGAAARTVGWEFAPSLAPEHKDRRFSDPAWDHNPWFFAQRQIYLAWSRLMHSLAAGAELDQPAADKAAFALGLIVDAVAPTNFFVSNPAALRRAGESHGRSVLRGVGNFCHDVATNRGRPRQVAESAFEVGRDLATTPGQVVFRNEMMELIQYRPQTETAFAVPLLLSPPWINKYYVMDLAPGRSFAEWAVSQGHTTFVISYRNPDASMRDVSLDDYLVQGLATALDVVTEITGAEAVNVAGLCVGGTLSVMLMAYLARVGDARVRSATLLNTLVDFSRPGPLGTFTDPASVDRLVRQMAGPGFLDGAQMAATFDALRANDLIWNYVASNWLMGEAPPAFDILAWNADSTRVPAAAHSEYLHACYLENRLARGVMTMAGRRLVPSDIAADVYILAAREDHITPWRSSYATVGLLDPARHETEVRFVLTSAGHVAGIVNPPGPKPKHWVTGDGTHDDLPADADAWLAGAEERAGSWWEDWAAWIKPRAGKRRRPPALGSALYPPLADAPGSYVHG